MPPKRGKAAAAPASPPLEGCCVVFTGTFPSYTQADLLSRAANLGAKARKSLTKDATHLIASDADYDKNSSKVKDAKSRGLYIVSLEWILDSEQYNLKKDEAQYQFGSGDTSSTAAPSQQSATHPRSQSQSQPKSNGSSLKRQASPPAEPEPKKKKIANFGEGQIAKTRDIRVPLDETCPLDSYGVYVDDEDVIWDASLNQTNAGDNNNKFYRLQLLYNGNGEFKTWSRWGRVGERGQGKILGNGSLEDARRNFEVKFKDKSGLLWANRTEDPKPKKYVFLERSYQADSNEEDGYTEADIDGKGKGNARKTPPCTLDISVQKLLELIFNQTYFQAAMSDLNYDANKLPLGKLSKATIMRGFQALKDLSALLDDPTLAANPAAALDIENFSNMFYSLIPHAFGRNHPPVIRSQDQVKQEIELLESLADMKDAAAIIKADISSRESIHPLDRQFLGLGMQEMTPLDRNSAEYQHLAQYLTNTRGHTHGVMYDIESIFRIERQGEFDRFGKSPYADQIQDRRLLWHGSRATNFGGILSQGLRIAPPEAPVSGYMFGKGIYLADMSSKSANYCVSQISGGTALLLLCEAELGNPMQHLINASYNAGEDAKAKGMWSIWGKGTTAPQRWKDAGCVHPSLAGVLMPDTSVMPGPTHELGACLQYNEYICYDVAQIRLRYLFRVKM